MMDAKKQAREVLDALPDDCTMEDIHYHLYVREKVLRGIDAADEGRSMTQKEAEAEVRSWSRSSGQNQH